MIITTLTDYMSAVSRLARERMVLRTSLELILYVLYIFKTFVN